MIMAAASGVSGRGFAAVKPRTRRVKIHRWRSRETSPLGLYPSKVAPCQRANLSDNYSENVIFPNSTTLIPPSSGGIEGIGERIPADEDALAARRGEKDPRLLPQRLIQQSHDRTNSVPKASRHASVHHIDLKRVEVIEPIQLCG